MKKTRLRLRKWVKKVVTTVATISGITLVTLNDFNGIIGLVVVLTMLGLFIGSASILYIDETTGW